MNLELAPEEETSLPKAIPSLDLSHTAQAFLSKLEKQRQQLESQNQKKELEGQKRHSLILLTLASIRRSLFDLSRISIGERFYFELVSDYYEGYPRLTVTIRDSKNEIKETLKFVVTAHDRQEKAVVEFYISSLQLTEFISLVKEQNVARIPQLLKKTTRVFLDEVEKFLLDENKEKALEKEEEEKEHFADFNLEQNELTAQGVMESLNPEEEIKELPEIKF